MATKTPPRVMTIAGTDSGGGAGVAADLRALTACGVHGCLAVTAVTVQNSFGVTGVHTLPPETVAAQIEAVATDIGLDAVKTGMLANVGDHRGDRRGLRPRRDRCGRAVPARRRPGGRVDARRPAAGRRRRSTRIRTLLFPRATLITPNLDEVRLLVGRRRARPRAQYEAAKLLHAMGPRYVLVKGGHLREDVDGCVDLLYDGHTFSELAGPRFATGNTHGSGDSMASAIASGLARGMAMPEAVAFGKRYVVEAVGTPTRSARATARCRRCGRSIRGGSGDAGPGSGSGAMSILGTRVVRVEDPAVPHPRRHLHRRPRRRAPGRRVARSRSSARRSRTPGIASIDVAAARAAPGVVAVVTGADGRPRAGRGRAADGPTTRWSRPWLATDRVRFVGEPVAAVLTEERLPGRGRRRAGRGRLRPAAGGGRPAAAAARRGAALPRRRHQHRRRLRRRAGPRRDLFDGCEVVVTPGDRQPAASPPSPLETRAAAAAWGDDGRRDRSGAPTRAPRHAQTQVAGWLGHRPSSRARDHARTSAAASARRSAPTRSTRCVAWLAQRRRPAGALERDPLGEHDRRCCTAAPRTRRSRSAARRDGTVAAYRLDVLQDAGAYPRLGAVLPTLTPHDGARRSTTSPGCESRRARGHQHHARSAPTAAPGRPEATAAIERAMDLFAAEIGMDPAEVRRQQPAAAVRRVPLTTNGRRDLRQRRLRRRRWTGCSTPPATPSCAPSRPRRRERGDAVQLGIGMSVLRRDHRRRRRAVAERRRGRGAPRRHGDRAHRHLAARAGARDGLGDAGQRRSSASRSRRSPSCTATPTSSRAAAARWARAACSRAARRCTRPRSSWSSWPSSARPTLLEADRRRPRGGPATRRGRRVRGTDTAVTLRPSWPRREPLRRADARFDRRRARRSRSARTSPSSRSTSRPARPSRRRIVTVDDAGHGAQPAARRGPAARRHRAGRRPGAARGGRLRRRRQPADRDASPTTRSSSATELPSFELVDMATPTPLNPLGVKGIGEAGHHRRHPGRAERRRSTRVAHLGVRHIDMPATPLRVWRAIQAARSRREARTDAGHRSPSTARRGRDDVEPRLLLVHYLRDVVRPAGHEHRLRHHLVRRLHGARSTASR